MSEKTVGDLFGVSKERLRQLEQKWNEQQLTNKEQGDLLRTVTVQQNKLDAAINVIESLDENFLTPPVKEQLGALLRILKHEEY